MPRFPEKDLLDSPPESLELEQPPEDVWAIALDDTTDNNHDSPQTITPSPTTKPNSARHTLYSIPDGLATIFSGSYKAFRAAQSSGLVRIIGGQGSGKSTFAAALIRDRILKGHRVIVFNHHIDYDTFKPLEIYGQGDTTEEQFQDISSGLKWFIEEREARYLTRRTKPRSEWLFMKQPISIVVEELGEYSGNVEPEIMQKFMKLLMIGIRKGNMNFIGISQGTTKTMFGGASGIKNVMEESIVDVHLLNQPDPNRPGGLGPKMSALVTVNGGEAVGVKLPDLTPIFPPGQLDKEEYDFTDLLPNGSPATNWLNPTTNNVVPFVIA